MGLPSGEKKKASPAPLLWLFCIPNIAPFGNNLEWLSTCTAGHQECVCEWQESLLPAVHMQSICLNQGVRVLPSWTILGLFGEPHPHREHYAALSMEAQFRKCCTYLQLRETCCATHRHIFLMPWMNSWLQFVFCALPHHVDCLPPVGCPPYPEP